MDQETGVSVLTGVFFFFFVRVRGVTRKYDTLIHSRVMGKKEVRRADQSRL